MWGITAYDKGYNLDATKTNTFRFRGPNSSTATSATDQMWINISGLVTSRGGFAKSGSSNSYVLLAGGGTKAISDFTMDTDMTAYMPKSGGQFTGPISFKDGTALPSKTLQYIIGIDAFTSGGQAG